MADDEREDRADMAIIGPSNPDGSLSVVRFGPDGPVSGVLTDASDGSSANGRELVHVSGRGPLCSIKTVYRGKGPAMVNSEVYRSGWDAVFGAKPDASLN